MKQTGPLDLLDLSGESTLIRESIERVTHLRSVGPTGGCVDNSISFVACSYSLGPLAGKRGPSGTFACIARTCPPHSPRYFLGFLSAGIRQPSISLPPGLKLGCTPRYTATAGVRP